MVIVPKKQHNNIASYYPFCFSIIILRRRFIPFITSIVNGGPRQEILGEGEMGVAHLLKMEPERAEREAFYGLGSWPAQEPGKILLSRCSVVRY